MRLLPLLLIGSSISLAAAEGVILNRWDFEDAKPFPNLSIEGEPPEVVPDPRDPGNKVMKAVLPVNAKRPERSEVRFGRIQEGSERWFGIRILRPTLPQMDFTCCYQLGPIDGAKGRGRGGLYQIAAYGTKAPEWHLRFYGRAEDDSGYRKSMGPVVAGAWEEWILHLRLKADRNGLIEVWRNGRQVINQVGQNAAPGDGIPVKWGIYIGKGNTASLELTALYDDVVIGDENCTGAQILAEMRKGHRKP